MFNNIGKKIKNCAEISCWLGIAGFVLYGLFFWMNVDFLTGLLITVIGSVGVWVASFTMYGFGELVENSQKSCNNTYEIYHLLKKMAPTGTATTTENVHPAASTSAAKKKSADDIWVCARCGRENPTGVIFCKGCGQCKAR